MKLADLLARGVQSCGGQLIFRQKYVGALNPDGSYTLNDDGKLVLAEFVTGYTFVPITQTQPPPLVLPDTPPLSAKTPRRVTVKPDDPLA